MPITLFIKDIKSDFFSNFLTMQNSQQHKNAITSFPPNLFSQTKQPKTVKTFSHNYNQNNPKTLKSPQRKTTIQQNFQLEERLTLVFLVENLELVPEVLANDFSGSVGDRVGDLGNTIELGLLREV